jgi:PIN domain nuclease of toxin-antitoxin system
MDLLIDTQILIWSFDTYSQLSGKHREVLEDVSNKIFVSQISLIEIAIKKNINKLPDFVPDLITIVNQLLNIGFELLPIKNNIYSRTSICHYFRNIETHSTAFLMQLPDRKTLQLLQPMLNFNFIHRLFKLFE